MQNLSHSHHMIDPISDLLTGRTRIWNYLIVYGGAGSQLCGII
ncbi:hypothetical protein [Leptospira alexanderi]|nr:hypothetical protein [Leptospira alexanderi]